MLKIGAFFSRSIKCIDNIGCIVFIDLRVSLYLLLPNMKLFLYQIMGFNDPHIPGPITKFN